jgi:hypothetical protein
MCFMHINLDQCVLNLSAFDSVLFGIVLFLYNKPSVRAAFLRVW